MNYRLVFNLIGKVLVLLGALMLLPLITSLVYLEYRAAVSFAIVLSASAGVGLLLALLVKPKNQYMYAKEGMVITALAWILMSLIGAVPFVISRAIPNYIDALFEIVSGFTTTGASILDNVETITSKGILFWRSFSHWIGGMGVLVFILAIVNRNDRSMHILRAEMPGPTVDKLVPKAKTTAFILYIIYIVLTLVEAIMLWCGDMNCFEAFVHAFGTAGTGGFGIKGDSITSYSHYSQWVITIFMLIFGVNFNLYFLLILGKFVSIFKNRELWIYIGVVVGSVLIISLNIFYVMRGAEGLLYKDDYGGALRDSAFQVASLMSTTGYSTVDFDQWPALSKAILFGLMMIGGCAGSTAGGFKLTRVILLGKKIGNDLKKALHPRTATVVKIDGVKVSDETIGGVTSYLAIYSFIFIAVFLILSLDTHIPEGFSAFETNLTASAAAFNNIGPGFAAIGPTHSFAFYSPVSKIVLIFAMLLGRLEIYPILLTLSPTTWIKR